MRSLQQLETELLQLPIDARISLIQLLAASLIQTTKPVKTPSMPLDIKTALLAMPNCGEDNDFARLKDEGRCIELSN